MPSTELVTNLSFVLQAQTRWIVQEEDMVTTEEMVTEDTMEEDQYVGPTQAVQCTTFGLVSMMVVYKGIIHGKLSM